MTESFTDFSRQGYFSRIGNAIVGVLFGIVLVLVAIGVLAWNEGRAVHRAKALSEGSAAVISVDPATVSPANDGKLVHFTGDASGEKLTDPLFGVSPTAIHLQRVVQTYQWKETESSTSQKDTVGGGTTTEKTYTYEKTWSEPMIRSADFKHPDGHTNPTTSRIPGQKWAAEHSTVGAFALSPALVDQIDDYAPLPIAADNVSHLPDDVRSDAKLVGDTCFVSGAQGQPINSDSPTVGDLKISLRMVAPSTVSVIARQTGSTLENFSTHSGETLKAFLYVGSHSAEEMFKTEQENNTRLTWILRAAGFVAMFIGMLLMLNPLKVVADVIGFVGSIVGAGVGFVSFGVAAVVSLVTIAIAWLAFRPIIGGSLIAGAVVMLVLVVTKMKSRTAKPA